MPAPIYVPRRLPPAAARASAPALPRTLAAGPGSRRPPVSAAASPEAIGAARGAVKALLERSEAFAALDPVKRRALAHDLVQIGSYLAEPDGVRLDPAQHSAPVRALAGTQDATDPPAFGEALRTGVAQAGALMKAVNFPEFVSGLIDGVFHSIVTSSIQQMEAYAKLVADVSKSLNQFRDDNTTQNQGRDHLVDQFPDIFEITMDTGAFGGFGQAEGQPAGPRVAMRENVDEAAAVKRINQALPLDKPITSLDDDLVEALLVPAARTQIATGRQQLLATMVMLGINRIVVTDGKISAKVMYDFQSRDNRRFQKSATQMDYARDAYGNLATTRTESGENEENIDKGSYTQNRTKDGGFDEDRRDGSYYSKGTYQYTDKPVITMMSASQLADDSSLTAKASLAGHVEVNFKSDYMPLDKLANPDAIAAIQMNAQPGMVRTMAGRQAAPAAVPPAAGTPAAAAAPPSPVA